MKPRPTGFLSQNHINHDSEIFDYIKELHSYMWILLRIIKPGCGGDLRNIIDKIIKAERLKNGQNQS